MQPDCPRLKTLTTVIDCFMTRSTGEFGYADVHFEGFRPNVLRGPIGDFRQIEKSAVGGGNRRPCGSR